MFINHWAENLGGAEYSLLELLSVIKSKFKCCLVTSQKGALVDRADDMGIPTHIINCNKTIVEITRGNTAFSILRHIPAVISFIVYSFKVNRLVKMYNPVFIHANVPKSHMCLSIISLCGYKGTCCYHMREIFKKAEFFPVMLYSLLYPRRNSCAIAISGAVKDRLIKRMRKDCAVIYNGIRVPEESKYYQDRRQNIRLFYLGRVVPWKGIHLLLDVMEMLNRRGFEKEVTFSVIGDTSYWTESYRNDLKQRIKSSSLNKNCRLLKHNEDIYSVFKEYDVLCSASELEPFGRSVAEAQGAGLPVISFNSGGIKEIVVHNRTGFLVSCCDLEAFFGAVVRFIEKPELIEEMGKRGREQVKSKFDTNIQGERFCKYIKKNIDRLNKRMTV